MSLAFTAEFLRTTPEITATAKALGKEAVLTRVLGRQVRNDLMTHFAGRQQDSPNKLGAPRSNFWLQVRSSVQQPVLKGKTQAEVEVSDPRFMQKVHGGTIRPKRAKSLTIPVHPQAYNRRARTIDGLVFIPGDRGEVTGMLVMPAKDGGFGEIFYLLRKSVTQKRDPKALPSFSDLQAATTRRAERWLARQRG